MSREFPQYKLRMSHELKDTIDNLAVKNNRSMNAEIVARLERSITQEDDKSSIRIEFDAAWFEGTGLSKEEFGTFVRMAVQDKIANIDRSK